MLNYYSVPGCKGVGGFSFFNEPTLQVKWRVVINCISLKTNNLWVPSLHSIVCHEHMKKEDDKINKAIIFVKRGTKIVKNQKKSTPLKMMLKSNTYFEDNAIEVEIEVRDSKEDLFLSIKTLANDSEAVKFYTAFYDLDHLIYFFNCLGPAATNLKYKSKLSPLEKCVLTLVKLRRNTQDFELAPFFCVF
ncbi:unnamed protein product [Lepeophtheirus salmonis]|uniref:(salmon louse) hypothetical protein n=1 Tax=Lepeophtheirus salmonis TaxID=72036 RepID=A0A7R8CK41_LEPSM|nr:unnamed protein product [Lepeophtheirus salmonis]CAF2846848.1 unnamed protein product [Lepeophtheirus salmonis]